MNLHAIVGRLAMGPFAKALPAMGDTERAALDAGTVGIEGDLFAGRPDFDAVRRRGPNRLTAREQRFLDDDVSALVAMLDDEAIDRAGDLPPHVWQFLRDRKFFGMIIPEAFGGLGFGHFAHASVVTRIAAVNTAAAVTVMVPNSLGPAELLLRYGTDAQKSHWLPRLADGRELPCFGLTSPYAGSDAASIPDTGTLCEREVDGRLVRGFSVRFDKRYITLAPVASVVGLAFQAVDPSRPDAARALGITCALLPVPTPGMQIGRRHRPMDAAFMNGPIRGDDVFVPLDWVIGGEAQVGRGWHMLMECLAAGRSISLPALGSAMQQTSLYVTTAYGQVREQFGLPIGRFHAVAGLVARIAVDLYATDAARRYTAAALDAGEQPSLAGAILKVQLTEAGRRAVNDGMDILGGKGIIRGPSNLLGIAHRQSPIAITVEGANLLTRSLIIFGQGAVRCHPQVQAEMAAVAAKDEEALGRALLDHAAGVLRKLGGSLFGAAVTGTPPRELEAEAAAIARMSAVFAFSVDAGMGLLGGQLKRLELLSARYGDILSCLYLATASVWRYEADAEPALLPVARAAIATQLARAAGLLRELHDNLPSALLRAVSPLLLHATRRHRAVPDDVMLELADGLRERPALLARLCPDLGRPRAGGLHDLMEAMDLARPLGDQLAQLQQDWRRTRSVDAAAANSRDPAAARAWLRVAERVIAVDDFAPEDIGAAATAADGDEAERRSQPDAEGTARDGTGRPSTRAVVALSAPVALTTRRGGARRPGAGDDDGRTGGDSSLAA